MKNARRHAGTLTVVQHEEREQEHRPLDLSILRRLFRYAANYAAKRNLLLALVVTRSIQLPALAWLIGFIISGPVSRMDPAGVALGAAGYALLALVTQGMFRYRVRLSLELGESVIYDLRNAMFEHLQRQPMKFFHQTRIGRLISRFTTDAEAVRLGVQDVLFVSLVQGGQMAVALALMLWYDRFLFLVVLAMAPVLWFINQHFRRQLSGAHRAVVESFSRVTATLAESVSGIRVIQGFVRQDVNAGLFHELVADHSRYNMDVARAAGVFIPLLDFNTQLFVAVVMIVGGWRVMQGQAQVENLYQFILMSNMFFGPIQNLGNQYNQALSAMAGAERVFRLLDTKPDWSDPPDAVVLPGIAGRVEFRDVTFGYLPDRPVLHGVSFVAEPGQTVALVGHTGSGKTSIINLIAKFYLPTRGEVLIDGREIRTLSSHSLHRHMGIVLQQNFLFTGTIMDNIRVGRPSATERDVREAAGQLDCLDVLEALPGGLATVVGESGAGLSLGQRQLVCFARAMLANPGILILDEATSSVDTFTESRIQTALSRLLKGRTSFVVAHRLSTVRYADTVLVLQAGHVVERGSHAELIAAGGVYADLYRQFARGAEAQA